MYAAITVGESDADVNVGARLFDKIRGISEVLEPP